MAEQHQRSPEWIRGARWGVEESARIARCRAGLAEMDEDRVGADTRAELRRRAQECRQLAEEIEALLLELPDDETVESDDPPNAFDDAHSRPTVVFDGPPVTEPEEEDGGSPWD